jgi:hypothetical protein
MRKLAAAAIATVLLLGLRAAPASAITNGVPDGDDHPYVGLAVFDTATGPAWRCSGSLLSPTVFLVAGHCTDGALAARVWMDEIVATNAEYPFSGATSYDGVPHTNPDFAIGAGNGLPGFAYRDVGVVVLTEPVPSSVVGADEYASLPTPNLVGTLRSKTPLDFVGYGVQTQITGGGPPAWTGLRNRMYAYGELVSGKFVHSGEFVRTTLNPGGGSGGTCFGDSGGPILLAGTDTILSVNSYVTNSNCGGVGYSSRVDLPVVLAWINGFLD